MKERAEKLEEKGEAPGAEEGGAEGALAQEEQCVAC